MTKRQKKTAEESGEQKEHKKNWREEYATVEEIKDFLRAHVFLRYNTVKHQVEVRLPTQDTFCCNEELEQFATDDWQLMDNRLYKTLLSALQTVKPARERDFELVMGSGFVPSYHPFQYYLNRLPPWDGQNHILLLAASVTVKGGGEKQLFFYKCLRKWLVAMVASWLDDEVVNQTILVFIGEQGLYKTTFFCYLLPPELRNYFRIKVNSSRMGKDDLIAMSQYGLVCYEELDVMRTSEVNTMKSVVTMPSIDERRPFERFMERMPHVASFCGTGNNVQFLNDSTGNRRWLPFEVERIDNPRDYPFDYAGIYAEAYALYRQGFCYYFTKDEEEMLKAHNKTFETPHPEQEAISNYFRLPNDNERGDFYTATDILGKIPYNPAVHLTIEKVGSAMKALGFPQHRSNGRRGYRVVTYKPDEIELNRHRLAYDATLEDDDDRVTRVT